jgi:hypothetical protein
MGGERSIRRPTDMSAVRTKKPAAASGRAPPPPVPNLSWQSEGLDDVIALFATGLRILLKMGSQQERPTEPKRSPDMGTEVTAVNGSDRYDVLVVEKYEDEAGAEKSNWTRIGVAFPHKDGNGLNVELKAMPVSGKLVIRPHDGKVCANEA